MLEPKIKEKPLLKILNMFVDDYGYGLRVDDIDYKEGDILPKSRKWENGDVTDVILDGTSTIGIVYNNDIKFFKETYEYLKCYYGKYLYLVKGKDYFQGQDMGEDILTDCEVILKIGEWYE